ATAFCGLIERVGVPVSEPVLTGLKMFCGDVGYRPLDLLDVKKRRADPERFFFEELPDQTKLLIEKLFSGYQDDITRALLQLAYRDDPFPPQFVIHQTSFSPQKDLEFAIFSIDELISLSAKYSGFSVKEYRIRKGRFKHDDRIHLAPR